MKSVPYLQLEACASSSGDLFLWVWVLGGVTKSGKELDPEPAPGRMYPDRPTAAAAAKKLGPKVWPVQCLYQLRGKIRWSRK